MVPVADPLVLQDNWIITIALVMVIIFDMQIFFDFDMQISLILHIFDFAYL